MHHTQRVVKNIVIAVNQCITKNWHLLPYANDLTSVDLVITNAQLFNQKTKIILFFQVSSEGGSNAKNYEQQIARGLGRLKSRISKIIFKLLHLRELPQIVFQVDDFVISRDKLDAIMRQI